MQIIYSPAWTENVIERLFCEIQIANELNHKLGMLCNLVEEVVPQIKQLDDDSQKLEYSLRATLKAMQYYKESSETNLMKAIADYQESGNLAKHIFN